MSKFFDFYKNPILLCGQFLNLITHTLQVVSMFGTAYYWKQLFFKKKHAKNMLRLQLSNHHLANVLFLSTYSFNPVIPSFCDCKQHQMSHKLWLLPYKFSYVFYPFKIVLPDPPVSNIVALRLKRLETSILINISVKIFIKLNLVQGCNCDTFLTELIFMACKTNCLFP